MSNWIRVDSYKDLPVGTWLVAVELPTGSTREYHIAEVADNMTTIGNHFAWDMPKVFKYKALDLS